MTSPVRRKLEQLVAQSPIVDEQIPDKWSAFREIELIDFPLTFSFRHSFGKVSRFFIELENKRLMGTCCPCCDSIWMPPRVICPEDQKVTNWIELPGHGTLEAFSRSAYSLGSDSGTESLVLGYIKLRGARTAMLQQLRNVSDGDNLAIGMPLKVRWTNGQVDHPMELFWFEPDL